MEVTGNENLYRVTVRFPEWCGSHAHDKDAYVIAASLDAALSAVNKAYISGKVVGIAELSITVIVAPPSQKEKP